MSLSTVASPCATEPKIRTFDTPRRAARRRMSSRRARSAARLGGSLSVVVADALMCPIVVPALCTPSGTEDRDRAAVPTVVVGARDAGPLLQ